MTCWSRVLLLTRPSLDQTRPNLDQTWNRWKTHRCRLLLTPAHLSEAESSDDGSGVVRAVVGAFVGEAKPSDSSKTTPNGKKDSPNKRKRQSSEGSLDPLGEKKVSKTWTDCHVTINNSWINPARLLKEVQRILKKRLEEAQRSEKDNAEKLETAIFKVKEEEEVIAGLKEKNERLVEELGEKEKELEEEEKTHLKIQQDLSKQVKTSVKVKDSALYTLLAMSKEILTLLQGNSYNVTKNDRRNSGATLRQKETKREKREKKRKNR